MANGQRLDSRFRGNDKSNIKIMPNGTLIIISSPSVCGKDAVINRLLKKFPNSARLITTTTRPPRPLDTPGVSYDFKNDEEFKAELAAGQYLEHNLYNGYYYAINKKRLAEMLANHDLVFTNIDVNGRRSVEKAGIQHLSIFLVPDSLENLRQRIEARGGLNNAQINERLETAKREIKNANEYNFQLTNTEGKLDETVQKVTDIIQKNT